MALETPTRSPLAVGPTKEALEELLADHQARIKGLLVKRSDELKETAHRLIAARSLEAETPGPQWKDLPFVPGLAGPVATGNLSRKIDRCRRNSIKVLLDSPAPGSTHFLFPPYFAAEPVQLERENMPGGSSPMTTQQARRADGHIELGAHADYRYGQSSGMGVNGSGAIGSLTAEAGLGVGRSSVKVGAAAVVAAAASCAVWPGNSAFADLELWLDVDVWRPSESASKLPTRLDHAEVKHYFVAKTIYERVQPGGSGFCDGISGDWNLEVAFDMPASAPAWGILFATLTAIANVWAGVDATSAAYATVDVEGCDSPPGDFKLCGGGIWVPCFIITTTPI